MLAIPEIEHSKSWSRQDHSIPCGTSCDRISLKGLRNAHTILALLDDAVVALMCNCAESPPAISRPGLDCLPNLSSRLSAPCRCVPVKPRLPVTQGVLPHLESYGETCPVCCRSVTELHTGSCNALHPAPHVHQASLPTDPRLSNSVRRP